MRKLMVICAGIVACTVSAKAEDSIEAKADNFSERFVFASVDPTLSWTTEANPAFGYVPQANPQAKLRQITVTAPHHRTRRGQRVASAGNDQANAVGRMAISQGATLGLAAANVPYAGQFVCMGMGFGQMVQEGIRDKENWTASDTVGNVGLSAAECFLHASSFMNARSPGEWFLRGADLVASYVTPYGMVPYFVRDKLIGSITQSYTPARSVSGRRVHKQVVQKITKKRNASQQTREQII